MIVGGEIGFPDWNMYNEDIIYELMKRNLKKCYNIISKQCWPNNLNRSGHRTRLFL